MSELETNRISQLWLTDSGVEAIMQASKCHMELDECGKGKCSVPMWCDGMPAGFCNELAYGEPINHRRGRYVPGLACPGHGGPGSRTFADGNMWCAVMPDFVNLQESPAGFGTTPEEARADLANHKA